MINQDTLKSLEDLHRLKSEGVITEAEFEKAKSDLLGANKASAAARPTLAKPFDGNLPSETDHFAWMTLPFKRYADFTGRSTRKEYWMFLLLVNLVIVGLAVFAAIDSDEYTGLGTLGNLSLGLMVLVFLGALVPLLAVEARRFHDQDMSGWFVALNLIPYVGPLVVLVFMLIDGTPGDNRFGPDLKGRG